MFLVSGRVKLFCGNVVEGSLTFFSFSSVICFYRQVTLFEELVLLKEYEIREDILAEKVANKQQEKLDMQSKVRI